MRDSLDKNVGLGIILCRRGSLTTQNRRFPREREGVQQGEGTLVTDPRKPSGREGHGGWVSRSQDGQSHFELQRIKDTRSQDLMSPRPWAVSKSF